MGVKTTIAELILNATAAGRSMLTAANAAAQKTLLSLVKGDVGLGNVDNTSDANKPVSTAQQTAIDAKIGGSVGGTTNRLVKSSGTGGGTVQASGITVDSSNNVSGVGTVSCGAITGSGGITVTGGGVSGTDGWKGGSYGSGYGAIWPASVTPNGSNYSLLFNANGMSINCAGGTIVLETAAVGRWQIRFDGTFAAGADNTYDIGESAARRPKNIYAAGQVIASSMMCAGTYTVATKPNEAANAGKFCRFSDNSVSVWGDPIAGGGGVPCMAYSNGTNWTVFSK